MPLGTVSMQQGGVLGLDMGLMGLQQGLQAYQQQQQAPQAQAMHYQVQAMHVNERVHEPRGHKQAPSNSASAGVSTDHMDKQELRRARR